MLVATWMMTQSKQIRKKLKVNQKFPWEKDFNLAITKKFLNEIHTWKHLFVTMTTEVRWCRKWLIISASSAISLTVTVTLLAHFRVVANEIKSRGFGDGKQLRLFIIIANGKHSIGTEIKSWNGMLLNSFVYRSFTRLSCVQRWGQSEEPSVHCSTLRVIKNILELITLSHVSSRLLCPFRVSSHFSS
jgi:hypothetical protein